jgi:hypothetical protein
VSETLPSVAAANIPGHQGLCLQASAFGAGEQLMLDNLWIEQ